MTPRQHRTAEYQGWSVFNVGDNRLQVQSIFEYGRCTEDQAIGFARLMGLKVDDHGFVQTD